MHRISRLTTAPATAGITENIMRIEEKFNKRDAKLIECQPPFVHSGSQYALGIVVKFFTNPDDADDRNLSMHLTPHEALKFAEDLLSAARCRLTDD